MRRRQGKSYLFEISETGFAIKAEFDNSFDWVKNMVVLNYHMILGMDKVVADVDITNKTITGYTPISLEAEADIIEVRDSE